MNIREQYDQPQRQAGIAILIILIKFLKVTIKSAWPLALSFFIGNQSDKIETFAGLLVISISLLNLLGSVLSYFRYYIQLQDDAIIIDKGILKRSKTNIPFDRIQSINFNQNLVHQFFGVVSIEIDTAGASKSELTIDALNKEKAKQIRDYILSVKSKVDETKTNDQYDLLTENVRKETILQLSNSDLLKVGISQNHLKSMFILLGFALTIVDDINRNFNGMVEEELEGYSNFIFSNQWIAPLFFFLSVAIISFIYSLVSTLLRNYHLHLELQEKGLKLIKGLINQEEISINKNKVQIIGWSDNPIRRLFKMWTINLEQASSTDANQLKSKITIPGSYIKQVNRVISEVFPRNIKYPMIEYGVSKLLLYRLVWYGSLLPFLLSMLSYFWIGWHVLWFMAWPLFHIPYVYFYYKKRSFEVSEEILKNNKGVFGNHYEMVQLHKIQGVEIKQSWYQRRKEVANLELFTAAGSLRIPFIPLEQAISLEKYVLYRIETDTRAWM